MQLTPAAFNDIRKAVHDLCGIVIAEDKQYLVKSRLEPILQGNGLASYEVARAAAEATRIRCCCKIRSIEAITTNETSFNRDGHPFEELRRSILPEARESTDRAESHGEACSSQGSHLVCGRGDRPGSLQRGDGSGGLPGGSIGPRLDHRRFPDPGVGHLQAMRSPRPARDDIPPRNSIGE